VLYPTLALVTRWEVMFFLVGLCLIIAFKLLTGQINTRYLLYGIRQDGTRYFSPMRVQLLVATLGIALEYLLKAAQAPTGTMPNLPDSSLEVLGLSNAAYLGSKGWAAFKKKLTREGN
jgi:hypothetical protein